MTQEERLELMKLFATGKHEIVLEKNVEYEIGNVEAGGIGVQINQGSSAGANKKDGRKKSSDKGKILEAVFTYTYLDDEEAGSRIAMIYQYLCRAKWLGEGTKPDVFRKLFLGEPGSFTMKWTGSQAELYYLIKRMCERKIVKCPTGATKWVITGSHFVDGQSHPFSDWNKQKKPLTSEAVIEKLVDVLDICVPIEEFKNRR